MSSFLADLSLHWEQLEWERKDGFDQKEDAKPRHRDWKGPGVQKQKRNEKTNKQKRNKNFLQQAKCEMWEKEPSKQNQQQN